MPSVSPRSRRVVAVLAALALGVPGISGVAGAAPRQDGAAPEPVEGVSPRSVEEAAPAVPFPDVEGVDLVGLGYTREPLDAAVLAEIGAPLPDDPGERVAAIADRLEVAPGQRDGLVQAQELLTKALADLDPSVGRLRAAHAVAEARRAEAEGRLAEARDRRRLRTDQLNDHRQQMAEVAVAAYVRPPDADVLASVLGGVATTNEDLTAGVLFSAKADHDGVVEDGLEVSLAVAGERLVEAKAEAQEAAQRVEEAWQALASLQARRDAHRLALQRVEAALFAVSQQIPALEADLEKTIQETWGALEELAGIGVTDVPVVTVQGIRVHAAIAPRLQALLAAAHADGVPLGGWGYRTVEQQVNLRRAHCGPTPEDIFAKPASACSPPTAKPGKSMHERGLAIDFHLAGRSITSHDNPGYVWLATHAHLFGFQNLPSEPWHWSVNGK
ncbi:MAG TPA: M15 family metallopeptidase [Acidimicrobiales bacterium]|nr:M15 family metallopeptidase [Acidimicrobiales bacterium]